MKYYPPVGTRGMAKMVNVTGFGKSEDQYIPDLDKNIINVVQIETLGALKDIVRIAAIEGVDVLYVGLADLSVALGIF